jgi:hypothetical protein
LSHFASRRLVVDYFAYAARPGAPAHRAARRRLLRLAQARRRLLPLCRASKCLCTSRGSSHGSLSTTSPHAGSSSTTSLTLRVRVPRHVVRLIVDYFAYAVRPSAPACRTACCASRRQLLRQRGASGCLGTSRGSSHGSSSTISPRASHRRLLCLRRASRCLGTSLGSSRGSSSSTSHCAGSLLTTSFMPCVRLPQLVVDHALSRRLTSCPSVALALTVCPVTAFRGATTRRPDCTGSTTPMSCIRTHRLAARILFGRSHWLSSCARSLRLAARLLVVRLHRLYCTYVVHPDASSLQSTSRRSVALALAVRPITSSRGSTSPSLNLLSGHTGSTSAHAMSRDYLPQGNASCRHNVVLRPHQLHLDYVICRPDIVFRLHRVDYSFENGCHAPND